MPEYAIEVQDLNKTFLTKQGFWKRKTRKTVAVENLTLNVEKGELFGLLGPNGAGKTTTVKMLCTLLLPTSGSIRIFGLDAIRDTNEIRKRIGFAFGGNRGLYGRLTARDNLRYFAELYALAPEFSRKRIPELLELVGLADRADDKVENFSSGMQQRLHLARALLHDPQLIFLDEPTVGIDPVGARELRQTVKILIDHGKTILLTTHYMAEADELCDHIAIIDHGNIRAFGTPASLKSLVKKETILEIKCPQENLDHLKSILTPLDLKTPVEYLNESPYTIARIATLQPAPLLDLFSPLLNQRLIESLEVRNQTMEDVYIAIIQGEGK
jgi:ABC-2 type transport system ATP-binding protein